jgi:hypothetical protein
VMQICSILHLHQNLTLQISPFRIMEYDCEGI